MLKVNSFVISKTHSQASKNIYKFVYGKQWRAPFKCLHIFNSHAHSIFDSLACQVKGLARETYCWSQIMHSSCHQCVLCGLLHSYLVLCIITNYFLCSIFLLRLIIYYHTLILSQTQTLKSTVHLYPELKSYYKLTLTKVIGGSRWHILARTV